MKSKNHLNYINCCDTWSLQITQVYSWISAKETWLVFSYILPSLFEEVWKTRNSMGKQSMKGVWRRQFGKIGWIYKWKMIYQRCWFTKCETHRMCRNASYPRFVVLVQYSNTSGYVFLEEKFLPAVTQYWDLSNGHPAREERIYSYLFLCFDSPFLPNIGLLQCWLQLGLTIIQIICLKSAI